MAAAAILPAAPLATLAMPAGGSLKKAGKSLKKAGGPGTPSGAKIGTTPGGGEVPARGMRGGALNKEVNQFLTTFCQKKTELSKGLKKEMMELVKKSRKVREASSESDLPEPGKKTEPEKAADTPGDESSSDWSFAGKPRPKRRSESPMPGKHGPRFKGTPPFPERTSVGEKKIKEEEEEDDDDDESEEPEKAKKKEKKKKKKQKA